MNPAETPVPNAKLARPPIIEAVLDIDCDLPPGRNLAELEPQARRLFQKNYPKARTQFLHEHRFEAAGDAPPTVQISQGIQALQFLHDDEKQLVQVRAQGFSFNRLAPYSSLDDYLPEIESSWYTYRQLSSPAQIRAVRLRYINRILIPLVEDRVELSEYLALSPRLPIQDELTFQGFLRQHSAREIKTGNDISIVLASQPLDGASLPVILDITVGRAGPASPEDWEWILTGLQSLRSLKNRIFRHTLTEKCVNSFQ